MALTRGKRVKAKKSSRGGVAKAAKRRTPTKAAKPGKAPKSKEARPAKASAPSVTIDEQGVSWIPAAAGYLVALVDKKLIARNPQGKTLASVPPTVTNSEAADQLLALRDWLGQHERQCLETVETWMLRSLPIPRPVLQSVWPDPAWRSQLENLVVVPVTQGVLDLDAPGFFRGVDDKKGVGVVTLDGETSWLKAEQVAIPHPILLPELGELREMAAELKLTQNFAQLFRESFQRDAKAEPASTSVDAYANGKFAQLLHALGKAKSLGYPVRGGNACCPVYEGGQRVEARFWIGADSPEGETYTGDLCWVDGRQRTLALRDVGPVAYSEGVRMAAAIYAARVVENTEEAA